MNERALSLLEQYDIEVLRTRKGRGTFVCETKNQNMCFQEYGGNPEKLKLQQKVLDRIKDLGLIKSEELIPNKEGQLYVRDGDGICYILKTYFEGAECNIYENRECIEAAQLLARLHHCMDGVILDYDEEMAVSEGNYPTLQRYSVLQEFEKHNRELMRVRSYLKKKGQKQIFEARLLSVMDYFIQQAVEVTLDWQAVLESSRTDTEKEPRECICHGDYQYHNILRTSEGWRIVNLEKIQLDNPIRDLYLFMRKVMEKNTWNIVQGREILGAYNAVRALDEYSMQDLYHRFAYPEKFWKITNFYYNSSKAWIPEKNLEKLEKVLYQEKMKQKFLKELWP